MQDRTGLTVFLVRVVFVLFETRRFCKVARFVFPDLSVSGNLQLKVSVQIGNGSAWSTFNLDGSPWHGFTLFVDHLTTNLDSRRLCHDSHCRCRIHHHAAKGTHTKQCYARYDSHFLVILHNINIRLNFKCMVLSQRIEHRLHDKSMALIVNEGGQTYFRGG